MITGMDVQRADQEESQDYRDEDQIVHRRPSGCHAGFVSRFTASTSLIRRSPGNQQGTARHQFFINEPVARRISTRVGRGFAEPYAVRILSRRSR